MNNILIIGSAASEFVNKVLAKYENSENICIHLMIPDHKISDFNNCQAKLIPFKGSFDQNSFSLFLEYKKINASEIIIVFGNEWYHDKIYNLIELWNLLLNRLPSQVNQRKGNPESSLFFQEDISSNEYSSFDFTNSILDSIPICFWIHRICNRISQYYID